MANLHLSWWDKLRGVIGYTFEVNTHKGWVYLHPNQDGSPYLMTKLGAEWGFEALAIQSGMDVRITAVKRRK